MLFRASFVVAVMAAAVLADNDWSKPCFSGTCEYDIPEGGLASGTLKIWGSKDAISDITPAAGWAIFDCSPDALQQDIKLVCSPGREADCNHLYNNDPHGKVVRLPENCGKAAFAIVAKAFIPEDQNIPTHVVKGLVDKNVVSSASTHKDGALPQVKGLSLVSDFSGATPALGKRQSSDAGVVEFAIQAANVPGIKGIEDAALGRRGIVGRNLKNDIKTALDRAIKDQFNINKGASLPVDFPRRSFNLIDRSISCPPLDRVTLKVDVDAAAHAVAAIGVTAKGTLIPPKMKQFAIVSSFSAELDGNLHLTSSATGHLDSGDIKLVDLNIAGVNFPGILSIGPSFTINAHATAQLVNVNAGLDVGVKYKIESADFTFPPTNDQPSGGFHFVDTPLAITAGAQFDAAAKIEAHLIPKLNIGLNALNGLDGADVYVEMDASANLDLQIDGRAASGAAAGSQGCAQMNAALDVHAGASAKFGHLFDKSNTLSLYNHKFHLFRKCFGGPSRRSLPMSRTVEREFQSIYGRDDISCPQGNLLAELQSITNGIVSASS